jgi:hypothetical protein
MSANNGSMREKMPHIAAYIDELRKIWGAELIDGIIRRGMKGEPVFYCTENGNEIGTKVFAADSPVFQADIQGVSGE